MGPDRQVRTNGLDEYLARPVQDPEAPRFFTEAEARERIHALYAPAPSFADDPALVPHLVVALWRWCRVVGQSLGRVAEDELLEDALSDLTPCPWTERLAPRLSPTDLALVRAGAFSTLHRVASQPDGLPLLPSRADPASWCGAFEVVAGDIRLVRAPRGPDVVHALTDPDSAMFVPVGAVQILELEELLVDQAQRVLLRHGERAVVDHFAERLGLTRRECMALSRLARADAHRHGRSNVEEDRALMVAQLQDFVDRAREALSIGDEIRGLRELARVQGLTRTEPDDVRSDFLGIVKSVSAARDARLALDAGSGDGSDDEDDDLDEPAPRRVARLAAAEEAG